MNGVNAFLDPRNVQGTTCYGVRGTDWNLVKRDQETGNFEPVDKMETGVSSQELDANYGVWVDKEVTKGHLWWKKTERPQDGKVQPEEVLDFAAFRKSQVSHIASRMVGQDELYTCKSAEINTTDLPSGKSVTLSTQWLLQNGDWNRYWEPMSPLAPAQAQARV